MARRVCARLRRLCWSERCWAVRLALAGSVFGAAAFGLESAGTAVAMGAAGLFAGVFLDDLERPAA